MAHYRQLQISYWHDEFVNELSPEEKFFYIYLMTNSMTTQCGIYKFNTKLAEYETGYNRDTIEKLLERFVSYGRVVVSETTKELMIVNWVKYNFINSKNVLACINKELKSAKDKSFVKRFYDLCENLEYPVEMIFKDIEIDGERVSKGFETVPEEETKKETEIKKEAEEELNKKELKSAAETDFYRSDEDFSKVVQAFNNNIHPITPMEHERLYDWLESVEGAVVILAIEEAVNNNARNMKYINTVLNSWYFLGIKTEAEAQAYLREHLEKKKRNKAYNNDSATYTKINAEAYKVLGE